MVRILFLIIFVFGTLCSAQASLNRFLTQDQIDRVRTLEASFNGVDKKTVFQAIRELEKTPHPEVNLEMKEAMARVYADIVRDYKIQGQQKKEWLYSMICLNMAYLQFGANQGSSSNDSSLNKLIRQKLRQYLPAGIVQQPGFLYSI